MIVENIKNFLMIGKINLQNYTAPWAKSRINRGVFIQWNKFPDLTHKPLKRFAFILQKELILRGPMNNGYMVWAVKKWFWWKILSQFKLYSYKLQLSIFKMVEILVSQFQVRNMNLNCTILHQGKFWFHQELWAVKCYLEYKKT